MKLNNQGLAPPIISIPKRRSLNNLKDDSPTGMTESEKEKEKEAKKKKRRSWFKSGEEEFDDEDTEYSDDEPGPSRQKATATTMGKNKNHPPPRGGRQNSLPFKEPAPFEPVPTVIPYDDDDSPNPYPRKPKSTTPGWRGMLGLKKKKSLDDMAEMARDENKARKAALAAESGAMLAGLPTATPQEGRSFKVARRSAPGQGHGSSSSSPSISAMMRPNGAASAPTEAPKSFKVKRARDPVPIQQSSGYEDIPLVSTQHQTTTLANTFKVHRPGTEAPSPTSSFIVNRPSATPPQSPTLPIGRQDTGRASPDIHASARGKGKASMFQSGSSPRL
jgi:hypothetical protein